MRYDKIVNLKNRLDNTKTSAFQWNTIRNNKRIPNSPPASAQITNSYSNNSKKNKTTIESYTATKPNTTRPSTSAMKFNTTNSPRE